MADKVFKIVRFKQDAYTAGQMFYNDVPLVMTFELPWVNNEHLLSCYPRGLYVAKYVNSPKHGWVYELQDVPGRADIQLHIGNILEDSIGCTLLCKYLGTVWKGWPWARKSYTGGLLSSQAFNEFMAVTGKDKEILIDVSGVSDGVK